MNKFAILREFFEFLKHRKKWWLAPIVVFLIILGFIVVASQASVVAPFVYVLF